MKKLELFSVVLLLVVSACGRAQKGDVTLPLPAVPNSAKQPKQSGGDAAPQNPGSNSGVVAMTLDEAKAKCVACHQPNSSGAAVWSTANGSEADWKAVAALRDLLIYSHNSSSGNLIA